MVYLFPHRDSGQETFRNVSYYNGHEEDHGPEEGITDNHGNDEEGPSEEDGQTGDDVNKVLNLNGDWCFLIPHARCQAGDATNDGAVTGVDN